MYSSFKKASENLADIKPIDYFFAKEVLDITTKTNKLTDEQSIELLHILIKLMNSYGFGHACENIKSIADKSFFVSSNEEEKSKPGYKIASYESILNILKTLKYKNLPIHFSKEFDSIYIKRLWLYENEIAEFLKSKIAVNADNLPSKNIITNLFSDSVEEIDWQKVAVINSLIRDFSIISGGPGTGKTTTVTKLLLALQIQNDANQKVALLAPTGKAAQRLTESIRNTTIRLKAAALDIPNDIYESVENLEGQTLHRFLGIQPNSDRIKFHSENKAPYDIVIVDEASMLDINIFIKLIRAIDTKTKLVLIGDMNQLPSVEAGSLLSSLTNHASNGFSKQALKIIKSISGYKLNQSSESDYTVKLVKNYRSQQYINDLAKDILESNFDKNKYQNEYINIFDNKTYKPLLKQYADIYRKVGQQANYKDALAQMNKFRILVANRNIYIGTVNINKEIEKFLHKTSAEIYKGKPIMITQNSYSLGLFNGDVGIIWPDENDKLRAYFEYRDGFKAFAINMLPAYETVYAMTIHKTQGSEFEHVAILLPGEINQSLTKELLYTGITRAKSKLDLVYSDDEIINKVLSKKIARNSNINGLLKAKK